MLFEVYDIETLKNLFTYTGYSIQEKKYFQFVITQNGTNEDGSVYTEYVPKVQELYNDIIKELEK